MSKCGGRSAWTKRSSEAKSDNDCRGRHLHTARFQFGANVVIQVLPYRLSSLILQIIRKECSWNGAQLETSPIGNEPCAVRPVGAVWVYTRVQTSQTQLRVD